MSAVSEPHGGTQLSAVSGRVLWHCCQRRLYRSDQKTKVVRKGAILAGMINMVDSMSKKECDYSFKFLFDFFSVKFVD